MEKMELLQYKHMSRCNYRESLLTRTATICVYASFRMNVGKLSQELYASSLKRRQPVFTEVASYLFIHSEVLLLEKYLFAQSRT